MGVHENRLIRLDFGEPSFPSPPEAKAEAIKYITNPTSHYAPISGDNHLLNKIKYYLEEQYSITIEKSLITVTSGGLMGLNTIIRCLKEKGVSRIYYPNPGFPPYQYMGKYIGIEMYSYPMVDEKETVQALCTLARSSPTESSGFLITSPNNPNGITFGTRSWEKIIAAMDRQFVICDNSFESFIFSQRKEPIMTMGENIFHSFSFSKTFSLADHRIGYVVAPTGNWSEDIARNHWFSQLSTSVISQKAAIGALNRKQNYLSNNKKTIERQMTQSIQSFSSNGIDVSYPDGGFFLWINIQDTGLSSDDFVHHALHYYRISVISGRTFGSHGEGYIRMNCATDELSLQEGVERLIQCYVERVNNYEYSL